MLTFFDKQTDASSEFDQEQLKKKLGWITMFREQFEEWGNLIQIITTTESFVRKHGLYHDSYLELGELLALFAHTERTKKARAQLLAFVAEESLKAKPNERLLLSISAMISTTTGDVVQKAMETVPTEKVLAWCKENIGQSVQAKRREAFVSHDKPKQK